MKYTALILAGSRNGKKDPVAQISSVDYKALTVIDGDTMIDRVLGAVRDSKIADKILISAPEDMIWESKEDNQRVPSDTSPVRSILKMLDAVDEEIPLFLTTADHALLNPKIILDFVENYDLENHDTGVAMLPLSVLSAKYPNIRRTRLKFSDGAYKGCNLFVFKNKSSAKKILNFWLSIETHRKNPWKMINALGVIWLLRYIFGKLSLQDALNILGKKTNTTPHAVILKTAEAAIDVDSVSDLEFVRNIIAEKK